MGAAEEALRRVRLSAHAWKHAGIPSGDSGGWHSAEALLARPDLSLEQVQQMGSDPNPNPNPSPGSSAVRQADARASGHIDSCSWP